MDNSTLHLAFKRWEWIEKEKPSKNCGTCKHFFRHAGHFLGECRRFPQSVTQEPEYLCGEYKIQWPESLK